MHLAAAVCETGPLTYSNRKSKLETALSIGMLETGQLAVRVEQAISKRFDTGGIAYDIAVLTVCFPPAEQTCRLGFADVHLRFMGVCSANSLGHGSG